MTDKIFVRRKISLIQRDLGRLANYKNENFNEVAQDWEKYSIVKNLLMEIIGRAIDINQHLIVELSTPEQGSPLDYTETFLKLVNMDILPADFGKNIAKSAGFRNAVVHGYDDLDEAIVYHSIKQAIDQYSKYCSYILDFIEGKD